MVKEKVAVAQESGEREGRGRGHCVSPEGAAGWKEEKEKEKERRGRSWRSFR